MANFPSNNAAFPGIRADGRSAFITRTYTHLVGGILGFILVELALFESGLAGQIAQFMLVAHRTRKDFSFLRALLMWGGVLALVAMIGGAIFGFQLGTWFSVAMIGFAGVAVLYDTSNIIHNYPEDRYVAAAMQLFASIALMFWYVLRLMMGNRN